MGVDDFPDESPKTQSLKNLFFRLYISVFINVFYQIKMEKEMSEKEKSKLKIISLGGLNQIGKNITVFEYEDDIIIVDCGVSFPDDNMLGVDLVIPDFTYLERNEKKIRGLILTHGHEDHIGAVPYFLKTINVPVYGSRLTLGILENKLEEHGLKRKCDLVEVPLGSNIKLGQFSVEFIAVNHSIPDAAALAITTPCGIVVHSGDFKIDLTPPEGNPIDLARLARLGSKGVLALLCESTNVERPGYTPSESVVCSFFDRIFYNCEKRVIIATFSTNVHRVQQIINASIAHGRKVAITGRSMQNVVKAAIRLGYIKMPEGVLIDVTECKRYKPSQITLITTGSQGEPMSALHRMAFGDHNQITIDENDLIILSSSPIPGNEKFVYNIINELMKRGAVIVNDEVDEVHVSGHACREELKIMHSLIKPKFFIPIHGEYRHLKRHAQLAIEMGMKEKNVLISEEGKIIELTKTKMSTAGMIQTNTVLVDGNGVGEVGLSVLRDRKRLSEDGLVVVAASIERLGRYILGEPEIMTKGFVYEKESEALIADVKAFVEKHLTDRLDNRANNIENVKNGLKDALSSYLYTKTKRKPMIITILMEVD